MKGRKKKTKQGPKRRSPKRVRRQKAVVTNRQVWRWVRCLMRVLRRVRKRRGLRLEEAAARAGITRHCLSKAERGRHDPLLGTFVRLIEALNVSLTELAMAVEGWKHRRSQRTGRG